MKTLYDSKIKAMLPQKLFPKSKFFAQGFV